MGRKGKYVRMSDPIEQRSGIYECSKGRCKWQGFKKQKSRTPENDGYGMVLTCPKCGNDEFYELLKQYVDEQ